jgi:hypothetical protein
MPKVFLKAESFIPVASHPANAFVNQAPGWRERNRNIRVTMYFELSVPGNDEGDLRANRLSSVRLVIGIDVVFNDVMVIFAIEEKSLEE